jgi:DNA-binding PadR family transcriptional regulator
MGQDLSRDLPVTSYALLGLLSFGDSLTGYELKQRADRTLRFYWVSPAMSQVYSELDRLHDLGLVRARGDGRTTSYSLTRRGTTALTRWLRETPVDFPVLKHPVALRLLLGALVDPATIVALLEEHLGALDEERAELEKVRVSLEGVDRPGDPFRYPALVADWGISYFEHERAIIEDLLVRIAAEES